jgi:hypothetical protein
MAKFEQFDVRVLRQDAPREASYWQSFRLTREQGLNVTGVLQGWVTPRACESFSPTSRLLH